MPADDAGQIEAPFRLPIAPMLATPGVLPTGAGWTYELKWDGVRVIAFAGAGAPVRLWSRAGNDVTAAYPELTDADFGPATGVVLDAEVVALNDAGVPDFGLLQRRMHVRDLPSIVRLVAEVPVEARVFDLLAVNGRSLLDEPLRVRRELLAELDLDVLWERTTYESDGADLLARSEVDGIEGVVAKRTQSRYRPGVRSPDWIKIKHVRTTDAIVVGWHPGEGSRSGGIGSLYLGAYDSGRMRLIGKVGSGLGQELLAMLRTELRDLERADPVLDVSSVPVRERRIAHWLEPVVVCEVAYLGWGHEGRLRAPVWRGLRLDIDPAAVTVRPAAER